MKHGRKIINRRILMMLSLLILCSISFRAQNIGGQLRDGSLQPVGYANIVLQTWDSTFVAGTVSDEKGEFKLQKVSAGNYRLKISSIGYSTLFLDMPDYEKSVSVGVLTLEEDTRQIGEVTVTASSLMSTAERRMVVPNKKHVDASANGVDLLRTLMLPRLSVDALSGAVGTTDGGTVQLCINGRNATQEEVQALLPEEIIRVETMDDPGVRYGDAAMMVNYVVRRYQMGGSVGVNGMQSVKSGFGRQNVTGKLNFGKSEISFYYNTNQQFFKELWHDKTETFSFADGKQYHRTQHAEMPGGKKDFQEWGAMTYNLQDEDKYMLNVTAKLGHGLSPTNRYIGKLYTEEFPNSVTDRDEQNHYRNLSPSLDVYFQRNLKNKQFLAVDFVGTYIGTKNRSSYVEWLEDEAVVDYTSGVNGKKYSFIGEAIYEKNFGKGCRLTTGLKHAQARTDNSYIGTLLYNTKMTQADTYAYLQYAGKWGKRLGYRLGVGVTRSYLEQEDEESYERYSFTPRLNMTYTFNEHWNAALEGRIQNRNPSLSQLSAVDQLTDSLQLKRGNPSLKPYTFYGTVMRLNFNQGKWYVGAYGRYNHYDNVIMEHTYREDDRFVHSYANHPSYREWHVGMNARVGMLWDVLQLKGYLGFVGQQSRGVDYRHTSNTLDWGMDAMVMWKNLTAGIGYSHNSDYLWGEYLSTGERAHYIDLRYRWKRLNIGLRMFNPFENDYARHERNMNRYAGYDEHYHIDDVARMVCVTLSWNMSFGRKYKSADKRVENSDRDAGVM